MNLNPIAAIVESVGAVIGDLHTSDKERLEIALEDKKIDAGLAAGQIEVNKVEAASASVFVSGARPAILWVGATSLAWTFVAHPMLVWAWAFMQSQGWIPVTLTPPPTLQSEELWVIVSGILGLGGYRTMEKVRGVASK